MRQLAGPPLPGKNCAAEFRKFVTWLRIIRRVSRVSGKVPGLRQTRLGHFWEIRYFDYLHSGWRSRSLRRVRNIQEYLLSIIRLATSDRAKGNSTNLQSSPAKPLFSCAADRPDLVLRQAERPRSSLARMTAKADGFAQASPPDQGRREPSVSSPHSAEPSPRTFRISQVSDWPEMSGQIASCSRARCAAAIRQFAIWLRITRERCDALSSNESGGRTPLGPSKGSTEGPHHKLPYSAPIPSYIARVPTYD